MNTNQNGIGAATHLALVAQTHAQMALTDATTAVESMDAEDPRVPIARATLEHGILLNYKGEWAIGRAIGTYHGVAPITGSIDDVISGRRWCDRAAEMARAVAHGGLLETDREPLFLDSNGSEILWCDGVPIVPSICPVVILRGSSYDMGYQYAEQIIDIFGAFIFRQHAGRAADPAFRSAVGPWERELAKYTPELTDFSRGWAAGVSSRGVPMDYLDVIAIWTGAHPPSKTAVGLGIPHGCNVRGVPQSEMLAAYLAFDPSTASAQAMCSGAAAWGAATAEGGALAACSTDHKCTFQATIVAFPDEGYPFIYTPFAANGFIPGMGDFFMAGHPGMNAAGLAYVHHGGGFGMTEPVESWGYGIRRGAETFHLLRYAANARDALRLDSTFPVGDAGYPVGYPGGFYADRSYGFVIEGRTGVPDTPALIVREASYDESGHAYEFLYATNNALSPQAGSGFGAPKDGYAYGAVEGWHTTLDDKLVVGTKVPETTARAWTAVSWKRNRYLFERLRARCGALRLEDMIALYQQGGPCSFVPGNAAEHPAVSAAHRGAAFTAAMDPHAGRYLGCVGPARRALPPLDGLPPFVYHDETHQFWELALAESPERLIDHAREQAVRDLSAAAGVDGKQPRAWADMARHALDLGDSLRGDDMNPTTLGRVVRKYLQAQVRSRQAIG